MALVRDHKIGAMVAIGGPVRWVKIHPVLRVAFASPTLVGMLPLRGTRLFAKTLLPHVMRHTPWLLSIYLNREHVDLANVDHLTRTVEDPNRFINREIARWVRNRDLILGDVNLTQALPTITTPLLCVEEP